MGKKKDFEGVEGWKTGECGCNGEKIRGRAKAKNKNDVKFVQNANDCKKELCNILNKVPRIITKMLKNDKICGKMEYQHIKVLIY